MRNVLGASNSAFDPRLDFIVLVIVGVIFLVFGAYRFSKIEI
jgi:ABC-2 type transport system permease protein